MTREEAITVLKMVEAHGSLVIKAKEMAIKSLEQEPRKGKWISTEALEESKAENVKRLTNLEWIDFLSEQFDISRTSAKEMLHTMMSVKKEDNLKKLFSQEKVCLVKDLVKEESEDKE